MPKKKKKKVERKIKVISFSKKRMKQKLLKTPHELKKLRSGRGVSWVSVEGVYKDTVEAIGKEFGLHPLVVEDILNRNQRPKIESYDGYLFIILRTLEWDKKERKLKTRQGCIVLMDNVVLSFQRSNGDIFKPVWDRIQDEKSWIRHRGADFLAYSLMDGVVDHYFNVMEELSSSLEKLQEQVIHKPSTQTVQHIHDFNRQLINLRKAVWPMRDVANKLGHGESALIKKGTMVYIRDVYDHTIQIIDQVESMRDLTSGLLDIYHSSVSNKLNEVMKVLTIIATLFIPITFITGVYGMNFTFMPEVEWKYGYLFAWGVMLAIISGMLVYFRRKKWI